MSPGTPEKLGTVGAVLAAAACPICFPKFALIGAAVGLGVLAPFEGCVAFGVQGLFVLALAGHLIAFRRHRNGWLLALATGATLILFAGFYAVPSSILLQIALANPDIEELGRSVQVGVTPVIISAAVQWASAGELARERDAFHRQLDAWRAACESRDLDRYLAHYAPQFRSDAMDLAAWREHKRKVNAGKDWIKIGLDRLSIFRSPGEQNLMVVTFEQDYRSSNLAQRTRKRQYWVEAGGRWKIAYEAQIRSPIVSLPESYRKVSR